MSYSDETSRAYLQLVREAEARADQGDEFALRCLAAMLLLSHGWRYGDPDPEDPDDDPDGGEPAICLDDYRSAA